MSDLTLVKELKKVIRKYKPGRKELENALREVRRDVSVLEIIGPVRNQPGRKLPKLPTDEQVQILLSTLEDDGRLVYRLMIKMLLYTGLRNDELCNLRVDGIDLRRNLFRVEQGKGGKDRNIPIFKEFRDALVLYLNSVPNNNYLFENRFGARYSTRYIRRIFSDTCKKAGLPRIHPHLIRHYFLTFLTRLGWTDAQIMLISGHDSKESLKIYQHLGLPDVEDKFQNDLKSMNV